MPEPEVLSCAGQRPALADRITARRPDAPYILPFMTFLLLLLLNDAFPYSWRAAAIALRGVGAFAVFWMFRRHLPDLGRPYWVIGIVAGVVGAVGWVAGQHFLNGFDIAGHKLGGRFIIFPGQPSAENPRVLFGPISDFAWYSQVVFRVLVATAVVPIVEEVFWRGFMLRAFIDWDHFDRVPLGTFTWASFLGTSLVSMLEHPDNWGVSIAYWMGCNALMYWKKSLRLCILTHAVTNLILFIYVPYNGDWIFW